MASWTPRAVPWAAEAAWPDTLGAARGWRERLLAAWADPLIEQAGWVPHRPAWWREPTPGRTRAWWCFTTALDLPAPPDAVNGLRLWHPGFVVIWVADEARGWVLYWRLQLEVRRRPRQIGWWWRDAHGWEVDGEHVANWVLRSAGLGTYRPWRAKAGIPTRSLRRIGRGRGTWPAP